MERFDKLPNYLKDVARTHLDDARWNIEYIDGYLEGAATVYEAIQSFEKAVDEEALKRAERWFNEEIAEKLPVDDVYTDELEEIHGYVFLTNVRSEWAYEFIARVEHEKNVLRDAYCKKGGPEGLDIR